MTESNTAILRENEKRFAPEKLWLKVKKAAKVTGKSTIEAALTLYNVSTANDTPAWCKGVIYGALGYFISLIDGIPDFTPILGYTDDVAVMAAALATLVAATSPPKLEKKPRPKPTQYLQTAPISLCSSLFMVVTVT